MTDESRPDPDALLRRVQAEEQREKRARLKLFFGFAPGVGKTYKMLENARELRASGVDLVVGCVETHGRYDTAGLLLGLEVMARKGVEYRGRTLREFDLEAALARRPAVMLVDELAHTNAPGLRHEKRWQDVLDLLDAGIEVHTTLNVQHVESLNDVIEQITSIRVRETVPDALLDRADHIELVDLPPEELLVRLKEGKVYLPDQATRAAESFFKRGNLLALRELALRVTAQRVDVDMRAWREAEGVRHAWAAAETILVCVGPGPGSAKLVRAARRMAAGLRAPWIAAFVESDARPLSEQDRQRLDEHLRLAESLGGKVVRLSGSGVARELLDYAATENVTRIIVGKPTHLRLRDLVRGSLLDELVRGSGDIDVHVISGERDEAPPEAAARSGHDQHRARDFGFAALLVTAATAVGSFGRAWFDQPDVAMLYLLVIMLVAARWGRWPSVLAAALSVAAYDFFFVLPLYDFAISDVRHLLTFAMMFGSGLVISALTFRIRLQERSARGRETRTNALLALSRELAVAPDAARAAGALATHASAVLGCPATVFVPHGDGPARAAAVAGMPTSGPQEQGVVDWSLEHRRVAGLGTDTLPGAPVLAIPLLSGPTTFGVLAVEPPASLTRDERDLLDAFARQGALALARAHLAEEARAAAVHVRAERLRSSLLSSVSHDLRTPLAAITGAASTLRDDRDRLTRPQQEELEETIVEEAEWLERLVSNLLDMTRLEQGGVEPRREWIPIEEVVGSALDRTRRLIDGRPVTTNVPHDLPLVFADPVLLQQLVANLVENAAKHTPPATPIEIEASADDTAFVVTVNDRGPGIVDPERIFEKFYRAGRNATPGAGLGLTICRAIAQLHGGTLTASNRPGGGSSFRLVLPRTGQPPEVTP